MTLFLAIFSIGIAIGSVMCNKLLKEKITGNLVPYGCVGITISIILLFIFGILYQANIAVFGIISLSAFIANIYGILIIFSLLSLAIFSGIYIVPLYAIIQHRAEKKQT